MKNFILAPMISEYPQGAIYDIKYKKHDFQNRTSKLVRQIRIEANVAIYDIKSEKHYFENLTSILIRQLRNRHTTACYLIIKFIGGSYDIELLCLNMRIENITEQSMI